VIADCVFSTFIVITLTHPNTNTWSSARAKRDKIFSPTTTRTLKTWAAETIMNHIYPSMQPFNGAYLEAKGALLQRSSGATNCLES